MTAPEPKAPFVLTEDIVATAVPPLAAATLVLNLDERAQDLADITSEVADAFVRWEPETSANAVRDFRRTLKDVQDNVQKFLDALPEELTS